METPTDKSKSQANTAIDSIQTNAPTNFNAPVTVNINQGTNRELLRSLKPCDFTAVRDERRLTRVSGTCEWIVQEPQFQQWSSKKKQVLWIFGKPGSGKSFIANYICKYMEKANPVMYFFFDSKHPNAKGQDLNSLRKFHQTCLHQLLKQVPQELRAECLKIVREKLPDGDLTPESLIEAISGVLEVLGSGCLVVDALDECAVNDSVVLKKWLEDLTALSRLQIVITSRPLEDMEVIAKDTLHLTLSSVAAKSNQDIQLYIEHRLKESDSLPSEMPEVVKRLKWKSKGMILYTRLMLDILEQTAGDEEELLDELGRLPSNLSKLYADRLKKVAGNVPTTQFVLKIFQWLAACKRPPSLSDLWGVDTIRRATERSKSFEWDPKKKKPGLEKNHFRSQLIKHCLPLVEILDDDNDTVRFVHATVRQFLEGKNLGSDDDEKCPEKFRVRAIDSHEFAAVTCITYLRWDFSTSATTKPDFLSSQRLRDYAVLEWASHSEKSQEQVMRNKEKKEAVLSFCNGAAFRAWLDSRAALDKAFRVQFAIEAGSVYPTPLHITIHFGLWQVARFFLQDIHSVDAVGSTPLHCAATRGSADFVRELMAAGARPDVADKNGSLPLHRAVRRGNYEAVAELVASGQAGIAAADKFRLTPLPIACQLGWKKCVDILLKHSTRSALADDSDIPTTAIRLAVENGHYPIVHRLLEWDKTLIDNCGEPLLQAARKGWAETVKFLVMRGADLSYKDRHGQTALHKACIAGNEELVRFFLEDKQIPPDPTDNSDRTPLYFAAERGHLEIVDCLIQNKADVNRLDRRRETPLFKPAGNGHVGVVDHLLTAGTDATILDLWSRTPLRFAAMKGRVDIVRMLLERTKIKQHIPDWSGRTVLHNAAAYLREGQEEVIDLLIEHGAQPGELNKNSRATALHAAIWRASDQPPPPKALIARLVKHGVPINATDQTGRSALFYATTTKNLDVVRTLLEAGASTNDSSFFMAVRSGNMDLVRLFLDPQFRPNLANQDWHGQTALHMAASFGYRDMVNELLKAGAPTEGLEQDKMTPLMCAEKSGHSDVVQLLRAAVWTPVGDYQSRAASKLLGRNVLHWAAGDGEDLRRYRLDKAALNQRDIVGRTPLHLAALSGCVHTVAQLLAAGPDTEVTDELGQTPAHYASERDDPTILALLIGARTDVEAPDKWGRRPLHLAARQGRSGAVRALLGAGALLPADKESQTPLHLAVVGGHDDVVRAMLETDRGRRAIDRGDGSQRTAIHLAAHDGRDSLLDILLRHVSDRSAAVVDMQDEMGKTALHLASEKGHLGVVRQLLDAGALAYRIDTGRYMAMHLAAEAGHGAIVGELLDALPAHVERCLDAWYPRLPNWASPKDGADSAFLEALAKVRALVQLPEDKRWVINPQVWAPANRPALAARMVSELRTWGSDRHSVPSTALMRAVFGGHANVVKLVLEKVPYMPLQAEQYEYANVLTLAAARGYAAIAALLIAAGSVVNAMTDGQNTALHVAAEGGHADVINVLLQNRGDPDLARLSDGSTPLHLAAEGGHEDAVRALADVAFLNAADDLGRTPLHRACLGRREIITKLLLDVDADGLARDANDATPMALAVDADFSEEMLGYMQEQVDRQRLREAAGY